MKDLENKVLEREINNNHDTNEVFIHQNKAVLSDLEDNLRESNNEIVLDIDINNIMPFYRLKTRMKQEEMEDNNFWSHVVSILFMQDLLNRYEIKTNHNIDEEKKVLSRDDIDDYFKIESVLASRDDVIESIKSLNLSNPRVHIILKYMTNEEVIEESLHYLEEGLPFITMIYYDGEIPIDKIDGKYNAKVFDHMEEGVLTHKEVNKTYEKKI